MILGKIQTLSDGERQQIHQAGIELLTSIGVRILSDKVLDMLEDAGVTVDRTAKTAVFTEQMIDQCIKSVPAQFPLYDRAGQKEYLIGDRSPKYASGHNAIFMADPFTNERRYAKVKDIEEYTRIADSLADIDIIGVPLNPQDVPSKSTLLHAMRALFTYTTKPLFFSTESRSVNAAIIEMMKATARDHNVRDYPSAISQLSPTSPLYWEKDAVEALVETSESFVPLNILPEPISGLSAPYSVAGLLTIHNTEVLSGIVISQIAAKGAPLLYGSSWTTYDMKYNSAIIGSPETDLLRAAGCEMADYYGIPAHTTAPNTDANAHDEQMAWEKALSTMCAAGARNDIIMNSGMFATGLSISHEQLVIDNEMNRYIKRISRGIDVSSESINIESIKKVAHAGSYLMEEQTLDNLYGDEFFQYEIGTTANFDSWQAAGAHDILQKASAKVREILQGSAHRYVDEQQLTAIDHAIAAFEKENP
ncbi:trimethylamine methyltransferase family protein [Christensenellaceae bacterium OttesenSCG-928-K19]|nr:trimethylamine methyltransferase family protein [Christensenellaceae bacterium OttesenSCG-928-K19]